MGKRISIVFQKGFLLPAKNTDLVGWQVDFWKLAVF